MFHIIKLPYEGYIEETYISKKPAQKELIHYKSKNVESVYKVVSDDEYHEIQRQYLKRGKKNIININYHNAQIFSSSKVGDYVFHNVDIWCDVEVLDIYLTLSMQAGKSFYHDDYCTPREDLELTCELGGSQLLIDLYSLGCEPSKEDLKYFCDEYDIEIDYIINNYDYAYELLTDLINQCKHEFEQYKIDHCISDDPEMYIFDESSECAEMKSPKYAKDLNDLLFIISSLDEMAERANMAAVDLYDACEFPTFGGEEPEDITEIFSWDEDQFLLYGTTLENKGWYITERY